MHPCNSCLVLVAAGLAAATMAAEPPVPTGWPRPPVVPVPSNLADSEALQRDFYDRLPRRFQGFLGRGQTTAVSSLALGVLGDPLLDFLETHATDPRLLARVAEARRDKAPVYARLALLDGRVDDAQRLLKDAWLRYSDQRYDYVALLTLCKGAALDPRAELDALGDVAPEEGELNRMASVLYCAVGDLEQATKYALAAVPRGDNLEHFNRQFFLISARRFAEADTLMAELYKQRGMEVPPTALQRAMAPARDGNAQRVYYPQMRVKELLARATRENADRLARSLAAIGFRNEAAKALASQEIPLTGTSDTHLALAWQRCGTLRFLGLEEAAQQLEERLWDAVAVALARSDRDRRPGQPEGTYFRTVFLQEYFPYGSGTERLDRRDRDRFVFWFCWLGDDYDAASICRRAQQARRITEGLEKPDLGADPLSRLLALVDPIRVAPVGRDRTGLIAAVDALRAVRQDALAIDLVTAYCRQERDDLQMQLLGDMALDHGRGAEALAWYERAARSDPISPTLMYRAGVALTRIAGKEQEGRKRMAMAQWLVLGAGRQAWELGELMRRHEGADAADRYLDQNARLLMAQESGLATGWISRGRKAAEARGDFAEALAFATQGLYLSYSPDLVGTTAEGIFHRQRALDAWARKDAQTLVDALERHRLQAVPDVDLLRRVHGFLKDADPAEANDLLSTAIEALAGAAAIADPGTPYESQWRALRELRDGR